MVCACRVEKNLYAVIRPDGAVTPGSLRLKMFDFRFITFDTNNQTFPVEKHFEPGLCGRWLQRRLIIKHICPAPAVEERTRR
jgi:hypothetical protein